MLHSRIKVYYKPTVVLTKSNGFVTGSARSVAGFDLYEAIENCADLLENFGGHVYAAGLTLKEENLAEFSRRLDDFIGKKITKEMLTPVTNIDCELDFSQITPKFFRILKQFQPFGPGNGNPVFMTENVYDDGNGYIDLGLDAVFDFDENGNLLAPQDNTWIAINEQPVAFRHEYTLGEGDEAIITGYVPALLNDERVNILITFDPEHPYGAITGLRRVYSDSETETIAKGVPAITDEIPDTDVDWADDESVFWKVGDRLDFICDYYSYTGVYEDSYFLGDPMTVTEDMTISYVDLGDGNLRQSYRFTDLYQQSYWTPALYR